jgi:acyl carrier protein
VTTTETSPDRQASTDSDTAISGRIDAGFVRSLIAFIADEVAHLDEPIDESTDLLLTGQVDSLGVVRVVLWLETELGIEIDPLDVVLENFQSVGQMAEYLRSR